MGRSPFSGDPQQNGGHRNIPILPSSTKPVESTHEDPMDMTPTASAVMGPPGHSSPEMETAGPLSNGNHGEATPMQNGTSGNGMSAAAATSSQQPKVVQTAFIHKLYNMLEDPTIANLISWSPNNESFVMSPSADFSKVLSQYFKHTNVSSFVRQLNMYGFHKVSDVFHTGSPESTLWEFKHGNGNFKRGDLAGLREIKRRASRHALIHRDSFSSPHKPSVSQPGTPAEPVVDPAELRLQNLEHSIFDLHARLSRTEESNTSLSAKCHVLNESLVKCHQWSLDLCHLLIPLIPDPDSPLRRDVATLERDILRQLDLVRSYEDPHESLLSGRQPYFSNMALNPEPLSPRQVAVDERRPSLHAVPPRPPAFKPQIPPPHPMSVPVPQRRYGSIGTANALPNYVRPMHPQTQINQPPSQHPLSMVSEPPGPNMGRRHTSADIRLPGWPGHGTDSPLASGQSSTHWPSSPTQAPMASDQHIRDSFASYELGAPRKSFNSHQTTPPLTSSDTSTSTVSTESHWSNPNPFASNPNPFASNQNPFGGSKFQSRHQLDSAPQTRRSSMASNVHSLLNPAETAERDEDEGTGPDDRKRKRMQ
ncbi:MAG: hypothetical protein Q9161_001130 [Pseudevernia consocians]